MKGGNPCVNCGHRRKDICLRGVVKGSLSEQTIIFCNEKQEGSKNG